MSRLFLSCFLLVLALGSGLGCKQRADQANVVPPEPEIVGVWRSTIQFTTGPFAPVKNLEFIYAFNAGGTLTESSNYDAAPPVPPAYGIWKRVDRNTIEAKYEFFLTRPPTAADGVRSGTGWLPAGRGIFWETISLSDDGTAYTSHITYEAYDPSGQPTADAGEATGRGTRLTF